MKGGLMTGLIVDLARTWPGVGVVDTLRVRRLNMAHTCLRGASYDALYDHDPYGLFTHRLIEDTGVIALKRLLDDSYGLHNCPRKTLCYKPDAREDDARKWQNDLGREGLRFEVENGELVLTFRLAPLGGEPTASPPAEIDDPFAGVASQ
jgi:hypothetical protein